MDVERRFLKDSYFSDGFSMKRSVAFSNGLSLLRVLVCRVLPRAWFQTEGKLYLAALLQAAASNTPA